jgi:hypothetical protein
MDKKFTLVYNPKYFPNEPSNKVLNKAKINDVYGAREGGKPSGKLLEKPGVYVLKPNELKKLRSDVAKYLLGKYKFLRKIDPRKVDDLMKEMKDKPFKCQLCNFESEKKVALTGHMRSHKLSPEAQKVLDEIPESTPDAFVVGAEYSRSGKTEVVSADQAEGIPTNSQPDRDGVSWYGKGLEENRRKGGMHRTPRALPAL